MANGRDNNMGMTMTFEQSPYSGDPITVDGVLAEVRQRAFDAGVTAWFTPDGVACLASAAPGDGDCWAVAVADDGGGLCGYNVVGRDGEDVQWYADGPSLMDGVAGVIRDLVNRHASLRQS